MAYVVLPSETARLVYGYLVKENLTDIALKFLESSPYLSDCCQLAKQGYNFNTKLMSKELHELLQEYSNIHNIVSNKVDSLPRTTSMYKKVKLKCETLSDIIRLFLFWKDTSSERSEVDLSDEDKEESSQNDSNHVKDIKDTIDNNVNDGFSNKEPENVHKDNISEKDRDNQSSFDSTSTNDSSKESNVNQNSEYITNENVISDNISKNIENMNMLMDAENQNVNMETESVILNEVEQESNVKVVRIETENDGETQTLDLFSNSLPQVGTVNNSQSVYVDSSVGNFSINKDSNVIIIPLEGFYKPDESYNNKNTDQNNEEQMIVNQEESDCNQETNLGYQEMTETSVPPMHPPITANELYSNNPNVDNNILTGDNFLKANDVQMYNLSNQTTAPVQPKQIRSITILPVQQKSQIVRRERFRTILPKKIKQEVVHPVIVVHPLLETNKDLRTLGSNPKPEKTRKAGKKKGNAAKPIVPVITLNDTGGDRDMPSIKTPVPDKVPAVLGKDQVPVNETIPDESEKGPGNEEKENEEKEETAKTETPVPVITTRNSKRLSLSTPRRRSHIRALEFETPPKTKDQKKSQTSPKIKNDGNVTIERKSVRNTLFKSPDQESVFKSPTCLKSGRKMNPRPEEVEEPLDELTTPIATRSPRLTALSESWEKLTGVGCVLGEESQRKSWDSDLRCFIQQTTVEKEDDKKRVRKTDKDAGKKPSKKKVSSCKKKSSKISVAAKRNTYSISENEEEELPRAPQEESMLATPFKDPEPIGSAEETPITKLLRENVNGYGNGYDFDLSNLNTPIFPPTPNIPTDPDLEEASNLPGSLVMLHYYTPMKEEAKEKNKKENQEKEIDEIFTKAKEIIGLSGEADDNAVKKPPTGKSLSMLKMQMIYQCDKKLIGNIPKTGNGNFVVDQTKTMIENLGEKMSTTDLKVEMEEKRKKTIEKLKSEPPKTKIRKPARKRKRSSESRKKCDEKSKPDSSNEAEEKKRAIVTSTPYANKSKPKFETPNSDRKYDDETLEEIRSEFPSFQNDSNRHPELSEKSRKKLHFVEHFLKVEEISNFVRNFDDKNPRKLTLKPAFRKFFQVFYKWLKRPHSHELNASETTRNVFKEHLKQFEIINRGLNGKSKKPVKKISEAIKGDNQNGGKLNEENKMAESDKRKEEENEDGIESTLPYKKRKANVQTVDVKVCEPQSEKPVDNPNTNTPENVSGISMGYLQDIDVDTFLSQIHKTAVQDNR